MITHIDLRNVTNQADLAVITGTYRRALKNERVRLTMAEVAWLYGFRYDYVRQLASSGRLRTTGRRKLRRTTHAWMRAYLTSKKKAGTPRRALKGLQQVLA